MDIQVYENIHQPFHADPRVTEANYRDIPVGTPHTFMAVRVVEDNRVVYFHNAYREEIWNEEKGELVDVEEGGDEAVEDGQAGPGGQEAR